MPKNSDDNSFDPDAFLRAGALLALPDGTVRLGCGPRRSPRPGATGTSLYAPDFFLDEDAPWLVFDRTLDVRRERLREALRRADRAPWDVTGSSSPSKRYFTDAFERIQTGFRRGRWAKVVPYAVAGFRTRTGPAEIAGAILRLLDLPPSLTPYGLWSEDGGILGATPELLMRKEGRRVTSAAVAGTRTRGSRQAPLRSDAKQLGEHRTVLADIESRLRAVGHVETRPIRTVGFGSLQHLSVGVSVGLTEPRGFEELIRLLHPTPAVGASPRGSADRLLRDLDEQMPRRRFGAPFGWRLENDDGFCVVAIRNVQWEGDHLRLATGCGVVPASRLEDEWAELEAKQAAVRSLIGLEE